MLTTVLRQGNKNFYKQIGLPDHFTWRGLLRRLRRQHPNWFKAARIGLTAGFMVATSMLALPGTLLPGQAAYKEWAFRKVERFSHLWYIRSGVPDLMAYLVVVYFLLSVKQSQGMLDEQSVCYYLRRANSVMEPKNESEYRVRDVAKIQNIRASARFLAQLIHGIKDQKKADLVISSSFTHQYARIMDNSIVKVGKVSEIDHKDYASCLMIVEYLLKYSQRQQLPVLLTQLADVLGEPGKSFMAPRFIKCQSLKAQIKKIFNKSPQCQQVIKKLLQTVEKQRRLTQTQ